MTDPSLVPSAIAAVFNIEDKGGSHDLVDSITRTLEDKNTLLILDNCEHVLDVAVQCADRILRSCPDVHMIVTTREAFSIQGEIVYRMPTLSVSEAVTLFVERAKAVDSRFELTEANRAIIEDIVQRLDGIALAIELAAPRIKVLGIDQLAKRLDQRLKLLAGGSRTALPRQQTLRALIGWSFELLSEPERALLRQLAVFRGSFTLDAVMEICGPHTAGDEQWDHLMLISSLIDKSLIVAEPGDDVRYRLLESTREYALERLEEAGELHEATRRHCQYFVEASDRAYDAVWTTNLDAWLAQTKADLENYRAAIDWALINGNDFLAGSAIVSNLLYLWEQSLSSEGHRLLGRAQAATSGIASGAMRARVLLAAGVFASRDTAELETCALAVALAQAAGDTMTHADALRVYGRNLTRSGKTEEGVQLTEQAAAIARSINKPRLTARILSSLGIWYSYHGRPDDAVPTLEQAASMLRGLGDRRRIVIALLNIAEAKFAVADVAGALAGAAEGVEIFRDTEGGSDEATLIRSNCAAYLLSASRVNEAWSYAREAVQLGVRTETSWAINIAVQHLAHVAALSGDLEGAARMLGHVNAMFEAAGTPREIRQASENIVYEDFVRLLQSRIEPDRLASLMREGAACDQAQIVAQALAIPQPQPAQMQTA